MKLVGNKEFGTYKDGSSIYKDNKGYYIVAVNVNSLENPMYKKYLKGWKPAKNAPHLCFTKKRWRPCKGSKKTRKSRK
jgi:hypothetical protein